MFLSLFKKMENGLQEFESVTIVLTMKGLKKKCFNKIYLKSHFLTVRMYLLALFI